MGRTFLSAERYGLSRGHLSTVAADSITSLTVIKETAGGVVSLPARYVRLCRTCPAQPDLLLTHNRRSPNKRLHDDFTGYRYYVGRDESCDWQNG